MYSLLFLRNEVIKFRYDMKALKQIMDLGINLLTVDFHEISNKKLGQIAYIGTVGLSYNDFLSLMDVNAMDIIDFSIDTLEDSFKKPKIEKNKVDEIEWEWGEEWEGIEKNDFKKKEIKQIETPEKEEFLDIEELLKNALSLGMTIEEFWNSTVYELYIKNTVELEKISIKNDNDIYLQYFNAYLTKVKKMPPIEKFVKSSKTVMSDEQMFNVVQGMNKVANEKE